MTLSTHSFGTRTFGDATTDAGIPVITGELILGSATLSGTATISPDGSIIVHGRARLDGRGRLVATVPFVQTSDPFTQAIQYRVRVVDFQGNGYADFENATLTNVHWELNGIGTCTFTIPTLDPKAIHLQVPKREVQIWRGNQLLWWGVMIRALANHDVTEVQCESLLWYYSRRFFGKADRTNHLENGSFELGAAHWDIGYVTYAEPIANVTHANYQWSIKTDKVVTGDKSLYLEQTGTVQYGVKASQGFEFTVDDAIDPEGTEWTFAVWVYIPSNKWVAANEAGRGVSITRYSTTEFDVVTPTGGGTPKSFPKVVEAVNISIEEDTPKDIWIRFEATLVQPFKSGEAEMVTCRVVCPHGAIYIDEATFTAAERTAFYDKDQAEIIRGILDHAVDPAYFKSDLNIDKNVQDTGIIRTREYWHSEHMLIGDALAEFPTLHQGVDIDIVVSPTTRTFTTYFPRKGIERPDTVLELGRNIETFSVNYDGAETANSIVVLGDGEGSDREEGGAYDLESLDGLVLEKVYNATPGSHIRTLDDQALRGLERYKVPVVIPNVTTYEGVGRLIGVLQVGDVVPVRINHGWVQVNDLYRIISITLDPLTERLTYAINPAEYSF